ncbi:hypothetical protein [Pseudoalteromonas sp. MTN2-4]|uniref:hypothetical protein n=1 Tax=Pseudoalteromonas sp. MTN2-4 TaxID=3056555 RepID=UPI000C0AEC65|nr:hypothetical protein [Pseudoalteromonas sp.]|tara:strand:- start:1037 stop:1243 length:207 start_codon:yes stop_codon:yes gene_type:complete
MIEKCPKCNGEMDIGRMPIPLKYLFGYKSLNQEQPSFELNVEKAKACLDCGYIELYLDPEKLRSKLGK